MTGDRECPVCGGHHGYPDYPCRTLLGDLAFSTDERPRPVGTPLPLTRPDAPCVDQASGAGADPSPLDLDARDVQEPVVLLAWVHALRDEADQLRMSIHDLCRAVERSAQPRGSCSTLVPGTAPPSPRGRRRP